MDTAFPLALLGLVSGFATTVWLVLGVASLRRRSYWSAISYVLLVLSNLAVAVIIGFTLTDHPLGLPTGVTVLILTPIFLIPPLHSFRAWRLTQRVVGHE